MPVYDLTSVKFDDFDPNGTINHFFYPYISEFVSIYSRNLLTSKNEDKDVSLQAAKSAVEEVADKFQVRPEDVVLQLQMGTIKLMGALKALKVRSFASR